MYSVFPILFDLGDIILHVHQQFHRQLWECSKVTIDMVTTIGTILYSANCLDS